MKEIAEHIHLTPRALEQVFFLNEKIATHATGISIREAIFEDVIELFDADFASTFLWDAVSRSSRNGKAFLIPQEMMDTYEEHLQPIDPHTGPMRSYRRAVLAEEVMPYEELRRTAFHHEFLGPIGMSSGLNMFLFDGAEDIGDFRLWRSDDREPFSETDRLLLNAFKEPIERAAIRQRVTYAGLTPREVDVALLVARGCRDMDIARVLDISTATVRTHLSHAMEKRGCANRAELAFSITTSYPASNDR